jgi:hypothetical protein
LDCASPLALFTFDSFTTPNHAPVDFPAPAPHFPAVRVVLRLAIVLLLVLSLGLHWAFLQTVAWTGMLIRYSQQNTFAEAVSQTFDGEHPCAMCKVVQQGRAAERQQEQQATQTGLKLEPSLIWRDAVMLPASPRGWICGPDIFHPSRNDEPPKPRPRSASSDLPSFA